MIPNSRSYQDKITSREEIWLEEKTEAKMRTWLRCRIMGAIEKCDNGFIAQVEVERCVQELRTGILNKLRSLLPAAATENSLHIPNTSGVLSDETAKMVEVDKERKHLMWGDITVQNHPEFQEINKYGAFHLVKKVIKPDEEVILTAPSEKKIRINMDQDPSIDLNSLPPRERIVVIENGLEQFEQLLLSKLSILKSERPNLSVSLRNPFHFVRANKANPLKYYGDAVQIAAKQRLPTEELLFPMAEPYYFTYAFKEDLNIEYGFMGYAPLLRTLVMNDYTSTENYLDAVAFMHEMVHCIHAAFQRKHSMNAYLQFAHAEGNPRRVVINEEFDAYAVELEALNLLLDNEMLEASEKDAILNPDKVYEELHLRPEQKGPISMLCRLGLSYFKGSSIGNFSDEYTSHVARIQIAHGFDIYASDYRLIAKNKDYRHKT